MRRKDKALSSDDVIRLLQVGEYGILSTADREGQAYGVPLNYVFTNAGLYFHCALEGHKIANILANSKVSFCVVGHTRVLPAMFSMEFESAIVFGDASVVYGDERYQALISLLEKYSPGYVTEGRKYIEQRDSRTQVVKIDVRLVTGKAALPQKVPSI